MGTHGFAKPAPNMAQQSSVSPALSGWRASCHNGAGRHCEIVTRRAIDDVLRYREYGPASRRYSVRPQPGRRHVMLAQRSGYGQPNIHTRLADEDRSLFVTFPPTALGDQA
eukprot:363504-Chlamydomonas_euryale.AAC.11